MLMRKLAFYILLLRLSVTYSQTDSVLFWFNNKLLSPSYEVVVSNNGLTFIEKYTFSKTHYWYLDTDTFPEIFFNELQNLKASSKKYESRSGCDTLINRIRNESLYWKTVNTMERNSNSYTNGCLPSWDRNMFYKKCHPEFVSWMQRAELKAYRCIDSAAIFHFVRMKDVSADTSLLTNKFINDFMHEDYFIFSSPDSKVLALIINYKTSVFIKSLNNLSENEYLYMLFKLQKFSMTINISELKHALKSTKEKSTRKKKAIKRIKNSIETDCDGF